MARCKYCDAPDYRFITCECGLTICPSCCANYDVDEMEDDR